MSTLPAERLEPLFPVVVAEGPVTLADLPLVKDARVVEVHVPGALGERLLEMGLTPGTPVAVVRRGMFGDPLQLSLRGYMLTLRRAQAQQIVVALHGPGATKSVV